MGLEMIKIIFILFISLINGPALAGDLPDLLDLPTTGPKDFQNSKEYLNSSIKKHLVKIGKFHLITENLSADKSEVAKACVDDNCALELGGALGADFVLKSRLKTFPKSFVFSGVLLEVETGRIKKTELIDDSIRKLQDPNSLKEVSILMAKKYPAFLKKKWVKSFQKTEKRASQIGFGGQVEQL